MTTPPPPAGWYADPNAPGQQRWWDGARWTEFSTTGGTSPTAAPRRNPAPGGTSSTAPGWRPTLSTWIVAALALLFGLIGAGSNGFGGFLVGISLFGIGAGIWTLASLRPGFLNLPRTRGAGGAALGISVAVLLLGAVVAPHSRPADPVDAARYGVASPADATSGSSGKETATPSTTPTPTPTPVQTTQVVETSEQIGFAQSSYDDPNTDAGTTAVVTAGVPGTKVSRWQITLVDGVETARTLLSESVTVAPIDEVTAVGTRQAPPPPPPAAPAPDSGGCDPNYSGACVPIASDVDCAGGSGNGPAYVAGPVQVIGSDIYDLDRDGDGVACE